MSKTSISDFKLQANRHNAQLSTGPSTEAGKAASSRNNFRHGLAGAFCVLPGESLEDFEQLRTDLEKEHEPSTATEELLVNDMARHYWLYQRALRLQEGCFATDIQSGDVQNRLSLYLRYGTTHERAFRRCLADLLKMRKQRLQLQRGFESQQRAEVAERRRGVAAQCRWAGNKSGRGIVPVSPHEVDDILQGFEALDEYFRTPDEDEEPLRSSGKGKGGRKAA
ncbi:MAG: hypothetical protein ACJ74Y_01035 [Bryobacteraceae bacterium]